MNLFQDIPTAEKDQVVASDFQVVVDISPFPIFIHKKGIIKYVNNLVCTLVKADKKEDLIGENMLRYVHTDDRARLIDALNVKEDTPAIDTVMEYRMVDKEQNVKTIQAKSTPVSFGGEQCRLVYLYNFDRAEQVAEEMHTKETLLEKLIEIIPDSIMVVNSVTRKEIYSNKSFIERLGYTPADYEGETEFDLLARKIHPDDMEKLIVARSFLNNADNTGIFINTEYRVLDKVGKWRWVMSRSCSLSPATDGVGRINFGMAQDITEAKEKEDNLTAYHQFQEKVNNTSPVLVTIFDIDLMTSIYRSQDMAEWFGYKKEDFPEKTIELIHHEYRQEAAEILHAMTRLKDGEIQTTIFPFILGDGNFKFILSRSTVFHRDETGRATQVLIAHSDVTDLKEIESQLDRSEETRQAMLYAIPDTLVIMNADGEIVDFYPNEMHREVLKTEDFIGRNLLTIVEPEVGENILQLVKQTIEESKLHSTEFKFAEDGRVSHYEVRISPFNERQVIIIARDISAQKISQQQIDHFHNELVLKNQELERYITSNSELEKFAYIASHDLREPLRSLTGFAQLLQKRNEGVLSEESQEFIDNIINGAQRMNTLVSGLLEYSRVSSAGKPFSNINLMDLTKKVRSDLKSVIEENMAELVVFDLPEIYCDELQIRQLFQNLISNAIKFRSDADPIVKIYAEKQDKYWLFKVEDNGIGIDMRYKEQVFQIFTRLHSQDKYQGSGIGLSVCKRILERHGGRIWLESTPGKGTTIFFTILI